MPTARAVESSQLESNCGGVDGNVIGVAFDAEVVGCGGERCRDLAQGGDGFGVRGGGTGVKEAGFAEADDEAVAAHFDGDGVMGDLVGEALVEIALDAVEVALDLGGRKDVFAHNDVHGQGGRFVAGAWRDGRVADGVGKDAQGFESRINGLG